MRGIWDVVIGVVGCVAIFGVFSFVKRLAAGMFSFVRKSSRARAPAANHLDFENEHPLIRRGIETTRAAGAAAGNGLWLTTGLTTMPGIRTKIAGSGAWGVSSRRPRPTLSPIIGAAY